MKKITGVFAVLVVSGLLMSLSGCLSNATPQSPALAETASSKSDSSALNAKSSSDSAVEPIDNLVKWVGDYEFSEYNLPDQNMFYYLSVFEENGVYYGDISINGFQTISRFQTIISGDENSIDFIFDKYLPDNRFELFTKGDILLSLKKENGEILTYWGSLQPMLISNAESGKVYFNAPRETDVFPIDNTHIPETTVLVNEQDDEKGLIYLGLPYDELIKILDENGIGHGKMEDFGSYVIDFRWNGGDFLILFDEENDVVNGMEVSGPAPVQATSTQKGLNIGDTYEKMVELYGDDYTMDTEQFIDEIYTIYNYQLGDHYFEVWFQSDKIISWRIGN